MVAENAGEGSDTVQSGISHTLGAHFENLTLTGSADINGSGNELDNAITATAERTCWREVRVRTSWLAARE